MLESISGIFMHLTVYEAYEASLESLTSGSRSKSEEGAEVAELASNTRGRSDAKHDLH